MDDQIQKLQVKLRKLNPHETFSILSEKYIILILHFRLFPNVTRKVGAFVGSCWATYPKKDTNLRKVIPAAERHMLTMRFLASGDSQVSLSYLF